MPLHLTKIAFGATSPESLRRWLEGQAGSASGEAWLTTRNLPTRAGELAGGSLYWIHAHTLVGRSPLLGFARTEDRRWTIRLEPRLIAVVPAPRRAHQGWRYLAAEDAPPDLSDGTIADADTMPAPLASELARLGLL
jgi:hypothetical protein